MRKYFGRMGICICLLAGWTGSIQVLAADAEIKDVQEAALFAEEMCGYVDLPYTIHSIEEETKDIDLLLEGELPAAYDARQQERVTPVKRQNPWGNCWSFAAISALESSLLSEGFSSDIDLSEYHLNYYTYTSVTDPLKGTEGDSFTYDGTLRQFLNGGGNILVSYHALANWVGAVAEETAGYPVEEPVELDNTVEGAYLQDIVHLQQMYQLNKSDKNAIKKEIMEHGALTASFYYKAGYYNSSTGGYYNNVSTSPNHAVAVVGWDDNYSKENFLRKPSADGAWLVKNSWGTDFGQQGYLWISYEDTSIGDAMCLLLAEEADNYENNYQYDGSYMSSQLTSENAMTVSNVFQIKEGKVREALRAVSFELGSTNTHYSIQIYGDLKDRSDPTSGIPLLEEPVTGTTVYQGFYTVELPAPVLFNPGEQAAVVITFEKDDKVSILIEKTAKWNKIQYVASAEENQSFLSEDGGMTWTDVGKKYGGNVRIKAFTDDTDLEPVYAVKEVTITPDRLELTVGDREQLQAVVLPEKASNKAVYWTSSDETIAEVDQNGYVTAHKRGRAEITCTSESEEKIAVSVQVLVRNAVALVPAETELAVGESTRLKLLINGEEEEIAIGEDFGWKVEVDPTVELSLDGTITGKGMGSCTVTFTNREDGGEKAAAVIDIRTPFQDIRTSEWQYPFVVTMYEQGLMMGKSLETFGTRDLLTRGEIVTILYAYAGKPECTYRDCFSDVKESDWFAIPVIWAAEHGIAVGYGSGSFGSTDSITREQLLLMLYRFAETGGYDVSHEEGGLEHFPDVEEVSDYAVCAMDWAVEKGMIAGRGDFLAPSGETSRGEGAAILTRFLETYKAAP